MGTLSSSTKQRIIVAKATTIEEAKEITYLTREYYDAMRKDKPLPKAKLPELREMLKANTIVNAYIQHQNLSLGDLKLANASLPPEIVAAVYMFANEPTLNVKLGPYQMFVLKHPSYKIHN